MKKSFILYLDQKELFEKLPDEQAGKLIKHIFSYVNCEEPETDDLLVDIAFSSVKSALKRDLKKWETQLEQRREAGKKSAEARAKRKSTSVNERSISSNEPQRNSTDSVNVSVNVNDNVSDSNKTLVANAPKYSQDDYDCAVWMLSMVRQINPTFKEPNLKTWANDIRKIINIDKRSYQEISDLFMWVNRDDFWSSNILSPAKLRKQWDKIYMKANQKPKGSQKTVNNLQACEDFLNDQF